MKIKNAAIGILTGVAVGALLGVLYAPAKGTVTRKKIRRKSHGYANALDNKFSEFMDGVTEQFASVREKALRLAEGAKSKVQKIEEEFTSGTNRKARQHSQLHS